MTAQNTRDGVRSAIFNNPRAKAQSERIDYYGVEVEVRQTTVGTAMGFANIEDQAEVALRMIIAYVFIAGTNEPVFEEGDIDALREMPMNEDFQRLMDAINRLVGVDSLIKAAAKK